MSNTMRNCRWLLASGAYCEKPVGWTMVEDGGEPGAEKVRKYKTWCAVHESKARYDKLREEFDDLLPVEENRARLDELAELIKREPQH
jgi:hypothetical protein